MGKQAKRRKRHFNGQEVPRPRPDDWRGQLTPAAREIYAECLRRWVPLGSEPEYVTALPDTERKGEP